MRMPKLLAVVLAIFLLIGVTSVGFADRKSGPYQYLVNSDGTAVITKYTGFDVKLTIPETIDGHTIVAIGKRAFYDNDFEEVVIPQSIQTIGLYAFAYCEDLTTVTASAVLIEDYAFEYCSSLQTVTLNTKGTTIGKYAFYSCDSMRNVDGIIMNPGEYSFAYCEDLTDIIVTGEKVSHHAFTNCGDLETVTFIGEDFAIEEYAFYDCESLVTINGTVKNPTKYSFAYCDSLEAITISGEKVSHHAFANCGDLKTVTFVGEDFVIEEYAFYDCESLITVNGTVKNPANYSFAYCESLKAITISGDEVSHHAFTNCGDLETVTFVGNCHTVEKYAFYDCERLQTVSGTVMNVGSYAFAYDDHLKSITISGSKVEDHAFTNCRSLKEVTFITAGINIDRYAFYDCEKLNTVNGIVGNVDDNAFAYCKNLESIRISDLEISSSAFEECTNVINQKEFVVVSNVNEWDCYECGDKNTGNFCSNCGAPRPQENQDEVLSSEETESVIVSVDNLEPTVAPAATKVPKTSTNKDLKSIVNYVLSPITTATATIIDEMSDGVYMVLMSDGNSYYVYIDAEDDTYIISCINRSYGHVVDDTFYYLTTGNNDIVSSFDYKSEEFINLLNYMMMDDEKTVEYIAPFVGDAYIVIDSNGDSYYVFSTYDESSVYIVLSCMSDM